MVRGILRKAGHPLPTHHVKRHVHFAPNVVEGSHRPPVAFQKSRATQAHLGSYRLGGGIDVPFNNWFAHYQKVAPAPLGSRAWALLSGLAGICQIFKEIIVSVYQTLTCQGARVPLNQRLCSQWNGVLNSFEAVIRPYTVIQRVQNLN